MQLDDALRTSRAVTLARIGNVFWDLDFHSSVNTLYSTEMQPWADAKNNIRQHPGTLPTTRYSDSQALQHNECYGSLYVRLCSQGQHSWHAREVQD